MEVYSPILISLQLIINCFRILELVDAKKSIPSCFLLEQHLDLLWRKKKSSAVVL
jgi:hypothetical protein